MRPIERGPFQDERGGLVVEVRPGVRAMVLDQDGNQILLPPVRNPLVGHVWRLMVGWKIYRNWYMGEGAFVRANPDVRRFVNAYFQEKDPVVAMGNLFSATERLLRAALKAEGAQGKILVATLPHLLGFCTSADHRYFNLYGMCCDIWSIFSIKSIRIGIEHGDYRHDKRELVSPAGILRIQTTPPWRSSSTDYWGVTSRCVRSSNRSTPTPARS